MTAGREPIVDAARDSQGGVFLSHQLLHARARLDGYAFELLDAGSFEQPFNPGIDVWAIRARLKFESVQYE